MSSGDGSVASGSLLWCRTSGSKCYRTVVTETVGDFFGNRMMFVDFRRVRMAAWVGGYWRMEG